MQSLEKNLNALMAVVISCVLLAAFGIQLFKHEQPCPLCLLQRLGMLGVACGALMNVRFGIRGAHYGLSIISAFTGGFVSLRHITLHICPNFPQWGSPFWGLSLYTWAFLVFASSVFYIALLLLIFDKRKFQEKIQKTNAFGIFAISFVFLISLGNIIGTLWLCGIGPCK